MEAGATQTNRGVSPESAAVRLWGWLFPLPPVAAATLLAHQRRALRRQVPILLAVLFTAAALVGIVFWDIADRGLVLAWIGAQWLYCGFGAWRWWQRHRVESPRPPTRRFVRRSIVTNLVPGVIWGSAALVFFMPDRFDLQVFLVFMMAGMAAGMVAAAPTMPAAALAYVLPTMVPLGVQMFLVGTQPATMIAIMCVIYIAALLFMLRNGYRSFSDGVVAEERARGAEEVLGDSIEALDDAYVLYDSDLRIVMHNRRYLELFTYLKDHPSLVGMNYETQVRAAIEAGFFALDDEKRRDPEAWVAARVGAMRSGKSASAELRVADGRTFHIRTHPMPGNRFVAITTDISALKQAEQRLLAAVDVMDDGFILYDADEHVALHNRRFLEQYPALRDLVPLIGRGRVELVQRLAESKVFPGVEKSGGVQRWAAEYLDLVHANGSTEFERETSDGRTFLVRTQPTGEGGSVAITTDITAVKRAEQRLFAALDAMDDGFILFGPDERVVLHNRRLIQQYPHLEALLPLAGHTREEIMMSHARARALKGAVDAPDLERWAAAELDFTRSMGATEFERETSSGLTYLIRTHITSDGSRLAITTDITAVKRAEQRLRAAIEAMDDGFVLFGPDGRVRLHNRKYLEHFPSLAALGPLVGRSRAEMVTQFAKSGAFRGIEEAGGVEAWTKSQLAYLDSPEGREFERVMTDGRSLLVRTQPMEEGGFVALTTDLTALKRAEKRLVDAVESMSDALVLWDQDDRLALCNTAYKKMFEGVPKSIETGVRFEDILRAGIASGVFPEAAGREEEYFEERMERHRNPGDPVIQPYRDGRWLRYAEQQTSEGGIVGLRTDVTETMLREQALRDSQRELAERVLELEALQQQLETQRDELRKLMRQVLSARDEAAAANVAKSVFLANMSHELRTPLNAIIGFSEIMHGALFGALGHPRYVGYVGDILGAGTHLLKLINDILDLSKIEAGKWELHEEPVDVRRMIEAVMRLFRGRDEAQRLKFEVDAPTGMPPILADERALKQILINAISNAVKFTHSGGRIRLRARRDGRGRLHIAIGDTGIGIKREDVAKAFAPFGQIDNYMTRRHQGTGLGLSLAKALAEQHGGKLRLRSRPGRGTVVAITLPQQRFAAGIALSANLAAE